MLTRSATNVRQKAIGRHVQRIEKELSANNFISITMKNKQWRQNKEVLQQQTYVNGIEWDFDFDRIISFSSKNSNLQKHNLGIVHLLEKLLGFLDRLPT